MTHVDKDARAPQNFANIIAVDKQTTGAERTAPKATHPWR